MNIRPLGDKLLLEPVTADEKSKGGLFIPDCAKEKPQEGIVRAVGTGRLDDKGNRVPFDVTVGDHVLVSKYGGVDIKVEGKDYKLASSDDVLAVLS